MNLLDETSFESCIKCTVCTTACPVSRVRPEYPGPKQAGPDGERLRLKDPSLYDDALKFCTNCKRCEVSVVALTSGAKGVESVPSKSVWLRIASRREGLCAPYLARAKMLRRAAYRQRLYREGKKTGQGRCPSR